MNFFTHVFMQPFVAAAIAASLVLAPVIALAHNNNDRDRDRGNRAEAERVLRLAHSPLEVFINHNGKVLVRGAIVTATSTSAINATTSFGSTTLPWIIKLASTTKFVPHHDGISSVADIAVGDVISFSGTLDTSATTLTLIARVVKDWSWKEKEDDDD